MSGTPRDGDSGWLRYEADQPDQTPDGTPDRTPVETAADDAHDSAWLRHDLPDPRATDVTDASDANRSAAGDAAAAGNAGAAARTPGSPWLPSEVEVARPMPTPEEAHDTGVAPTIVVEAEDSTPAHRSSATQPLPDEAEPGAAGSHGGAVGDPRAERRGDRDDERDDERGDDRDDERDDERDANRHADDESVGGLAVLGAAIKEFAIVVGMALVLSFIVKTWLLQAFYIPSGSMEDTLVLNDRVIVSKLTPGPIDLKRGDIVVFADPGQWLDEAPKAQQGPVATVVTETLTFVGLLPDNAENHLIKRVIGLPGDHVVCCDEGGRITINGTAIKEPYLKPGDAASEQDFDITVPSGRVWVMGDHRSNSADSRVHDGPENNGSVGSVDERLIVGRAVALVWPLDHLTWLSNPTATFAQVPAPSSATATTQGSGVTGGQGGGPGGGEVGGTDTPTGSG